MSTLTQIASEMRNLLSSVQKGYVQRILFGGLNVVLERRATTWRLAIARDGAWPSDVEVTTVARHFGLPDGVTWERSQKKQQKRKIVAGGRGRGRGGAHVWITLLGT